MITMRCPSCGATLEPPDGNGVAQCLPCGTRAILGPNDAGREAQQVRRHSSLCKVALEAKNFQEAVQYCNAILEIEPENVGAWLDKATATFWLTTGANNRYDEAVGYLNRASEIEPGSQRVAASYVELAQNQAWWMNKLGLDSFNTAQKMYGIYADRQYRDEIDRIESVSKAKQASLHYFFEAMSHYRQAVILAPANVSYHESIAECAETASWIDWKWASVSDSLELLRSLDAKKQAQEVLPGLSQELECKEQEWERLKSDTGIFSRLRRDSVRSRLETLRAEIAKQESAAAYEPGGGKSV
jgi:tetratricopeptide (TPR) repeat protein